MVLGSVALSLVMLGCEALSLVVLGNVALTGGAGQCGAISWCWAVWRYLVVLGSLAPIFRDYMSYDVPVVSSDWPSAVANGKKKIAGGEFSLLPC